jgi:hypothetical protein
MSRPHRPTRAERARQLMTSIMNGPYLTPPSNHPQFDAYFDAERRCRLWLRCWIEPLVRSLIPELHDAPDTLDQIVQWTPTAHRNAQD